MRRYHALPVAILATLTLLAGGAMAQPSTDFLANAAAGLKTLQAWYVPETGLWQTTNWWNAANGVTVLVRYSKLSASAEFRPVIANTFERNTNGKFPNFLN